MPPEMRAQYQEGAEETHSALAAAEVSDEEPASFEIIEDNQAVKKREGFFDKAKRRIVEDFKENRLDNLRARRQDSLLVFHYNQEKLDKLNKEIAVLENAGLSENSKKKLEQERERLQNIIDSSKEKAEKFTQELKPLLTERESEERKQDKVLLGDDRLYSDPTEKDENGKTVYGQEDDTPENIDSEIMLLEKNFEIAKTIIEEKKKRIEALKKQIRDLEELTRSASFNESKSAATSKLPEIRKDQKEAEKELENAELGFRRIKNRLNIFLEIK